jgi:hypothetical protein
MIAVGLWIQPIKELRVIWKGHRVSYEVNSIGATVAGPPLLGRTTICVDARVGQLA